MINDNFAMQNPNFYFIFPTSILQYIAYILVLVLIFVLLILISSSSSRSNSNNNYDNQAYYYCHYFNIVLCTV